MLFNAGYSKQHHEELLSHLDASLAPATKRARETHLFKLVQFTKMYKLDIFKLNSYDVLSYIVFLKKHFKSPGAVSNYLSGARMWTLAATGTAAPFDTHHATVLKRGLARSMKHSTTQVPPLRVDELRHLAAVLDRLGKQARVIKALVLIAFYTALRQSNLLVNRNASLPSEHVMLTKDIVVRENALLITIHSSKTIKASENGKTFKLPEATKALCCPVRAWKRYAGFARPKPGAPAFQTEGGIPLTVRGATNLIRKALIGSNYKEPNRFTLHALRRGAIHACVEGGADLEQVKELGQWASRAVNRYLPGKSVITAAPSTLKAYIG